jgi:hypothetical protein
MDPEYYMNPEYYRARAAEATRKARADLFNSHTYRDVACCYERLAADSDQQTPTRPAPRDQNRSQ